MHLSTDRHPARAASVLGLAALGALLLGACSAEEPTSQTTDQTTTTAASPEQTASPEQARSDSGETLTADELTQILLPADELPPGIMQDRADQVSEGNSFSLNLTLNGVEPQGQCAQAVQEVNDVDVPVVVGVSGDYEVVDELQGGARVPSLQTIAVVTEEPVDAMGLYRALAEACPTVESATEGGAVATMTRIGDLGAVQILFEVGPQGARQAMDGLAIGGDSVGRHHIYLAASRLPEKEAEEIFQAQVERFHQALEEHGIPVED